MALLTPGPSVPPTRLQHKPIHGPRTRSHLGLAAPDNCQQLAGPKAQLQSLSSRRGLGCSSSQGGHSSCNSFQAPLQPWDAQAASRGGAADPGPRRRTARRNSDQGQGAGNQRQGKAAAPSASLTAPDRHSGGSRPAPRALGSTPWAGPAPGLSWEVEPGPEDTVARSSSSSGRRDRDVRGRATAFPSVSRTGSSAVVVAAQESGHHGCLYYPPSNSNFFPSLLANYPASVLISFYY